MENLDVMRRITKAFFGAVLATLLTAESGCDSGTKLIKTEGVVTLDGVPVAGATITLYPDSDKGSMATGLTDADGGFELQTKAAVGVLPGNYKVTVNKSDAAGSPPNDPAKQKEWMMKMMFNRPTKKSRDSGLPREYTSLSRTPLRARVPSEGPVILRLTKSPGT